MLKYFFAVFTAIFLAFPLQAAPPNKVDSLELPADQTVAYDEGFITIQAKTDGVVKWLVISNQKIKYVPLDATKSIIISVPPTGGQISVFAVALVGTKLTEFARTTVTIGNPSPNPNPTPTPDPNPKPNPGSVPVHVTFLVDLNQTTPELAAILNSQTLRQWMKENNLLFRYYDYSSATVKQLKLDTIINKVGGNAVMVVQDKAGVVLQAIKIPASEQEIENSINSLRQK